MLPVNCSWLYCGKFKLMLASTMALLAKKLQPSLRSLLLQDAIKSKEITIKNLFIGLKNVLRNLRQNMRCNKYFVYLSFNLVRAGFFLCWKSIDTFTVFLILQGKKYPLIKINCFHSNPSVNSSLKFLRKTDWARQKVETLYLQTKF